VKPDGLFDGHMTAPFDANEPHRPQAWRNASRWAVRVLATAAGALGGYLVGRLIEACQSPIECIRPLVG